MSAPARMPLGQLLLERKYIQEAQLKEALELQMSLPDNSHIHLGEVLLSMGYITEQQLNEALEQQPILSKPVIGQLLLGKGLITEWQLSRALYIQFSNKVNQKEHKKLGHILSELGYVEQAEIDALFTPEQAEQEQSEYSVY